MPKRINTEALWAGRSHKRGDRPSDPRESGAAQYGKRTIREHRERTALAADRHSDDLGEETRKFYEDLENSPADPPRVGEFDHDSGDEDGADFEHVESNV